MGGSRRLTAAVRIFAGVVLCAAGLSVAAVTAGDAGAAGATAVPAGSHPGAVPLPALPGAGHAESPRAATARTPGAPRVAPLSTASVTLVVDSTADAAPATAACATGNPGTCTLRAAVETADAAAGAVDVVDVPAGTYDLDATLGPLAVTQSMHIVGTAAAATVVVDGDGAVQVVHVAGTAVTVTPTTTTTFTVRVGPALLLQSLTLADGDATGAATEGSAGGDLALYAASAVLEDVTVTGGRGLDGGDVYVGYDSDLWADGGSSLDTGAAVDQGGGLQVAGLPTASTPTPITNLPGANPAKGGSAVLTGTTLSDDSAPFGGAIFDDGTVTVTGAHFDHDSAGDGGAVYNTQEYTDTGSTYTDDSVAGGDFTAVGGAAVFNVNQASLSGSTVVTARVDAATRSAVGGVLYNARGMALDDVTVEGTQVVCTGQLVVGGVVANDPWYYGSDLTTQPELTVSGLDVTGTGVAPATAPGCEVAGGVLANLAQADVEGLEASGTDVTGGSDGVEGGVAFDGPFGTTPAALVLSGSGATTTHVTLSGAGSVYGGVLSLATKHDTATLDDVSVSDTTVVSGSGTVRGGAVDEDTDGGITGLSVSSTAVTAGGATAKVFGGAVLTTGHLTVDGMSVTGTVVDAAVSANGKIHGGAWFETTIVTARDVQLLTTTVTASKGITGGSLMINDAASILDSTIARTVATVPAGGNGIYGGIATFEGKQISLVNVTMDDNTTTVPATGPAIGVDVATSVQFTNDTVVGDVVRTTPADSFGAISGGIDVIHTSAASFENTLVAFSTVPACAKTQSTGNTLAIVTSVGGNIDADGSCGFDQSSDRSTVTPLVGEVQTNGGPVQTAALLPGSPAAGRGLPAGAPATDARGVARPAGHIDSGAFQLSGPAAFTSAAPPTTATVGVAYGYDFLASGYPAPTYALSGAPAWLTIDPATGALAGTPPAGTTSFGYSVTASNGIGTAAVAGPFHVTVVTPRGAGYDELGSDGAVYAFGTAPTAGSMAGVALSAPVVGGAMTPTGDGYWEVAADGGIFTFGDARYLGSMATHRLNAPIVGMAAMPTGGGYWEVASDGGIFSFGTAAFHGSMGGMALNQPIVGMAAMPTGGGYWEVASDGGIFSFGTAHFHGSMGGMALNQPIVGMAAMPTGGGYWEVASDGGIFSFGTAVFHGSMGGVHLDAPIVGMAATGTGAGYWEFAADGGVFTFGRASFLGSAAAKGVSAPVVGGVALGTL